MSKLKSISLDENTQIYIEATEEADVSEVMLDAALDETAEPQRSGDYPGAEEQTRTAKGPGAFTARTAQRLNDKAQTMGSLIERYTSTTLKAFHEVSLAEVKKVTLEFGVNVNGMTGLPYIASGTAGCNVKVTVECAFPDRSADSKAADPKDAR